MKCTIAIAVAGIGIRFGKQLLGRTGIWNW
jgi:hypothetical protein